MLISKTWWRVRASVVRVIDGDTFAVDLDLGWGIVRRESPGSPCRVRILNYNTPEKGKPLWSEATKMLSDELPVGTVVWLTSHALDSFGRALCSVEMEDGTDLLSKLPSNWVIR